MRLFYFQVIDLSDCSNGPMRMDVHLSFTRLQVSYSREQQLTSQENNQNSELRLRTRTRTKNQEHFTETLRHLKEDNGD